MALSEVGESQASPLEADVRGALRHAGVLASLLFARPAPTQADYREHPEASRLQNGGGLLRLLAIGVSALVLAGCGSTNPRRAAYEPEEFDSTTTHTRSFAATEAQTCEAARRALLSQGYLISGANADLVTGRKSFQPDRELHMEVEFRVVCAREVGRAGLPGSTVAFVSALQDRYGLKKANSSASVGVGAFGSLSLPFSSSDEAMVKVASETLTDERFYDRFFSLLERFLATAPNGDRTAPEPGAVPMPVPAPAPIQPVRTDPVQASPNRG